MINGKVIDVGLDEKGNIKVTTEYTLPTGAKVKGAMCYAFFNYSRERVLKDITAHCEVLMRRVWMLKKHQELVSSIAVEGLAKSITECEIVTTRAVRDKLGNIITPEEKITIDDK